MTDLPTHESGAPARSRRLRWLGRVARYTGGSVVATVCSEATLVVLYGPLDVDPSLAAVLAWLAGALPNYWLNRRWAWGRRDRPSLRHEVLPYAAIIAVTLALASVATRAVDAWLVHLGTRSDLRVTLVAAAFLGVYVVMFVLRFFMLDRLFARVAAKFDHPDVGSHAEPVDQP